MNDVPEGPNFRLGVFGASWGVGGRKEATTMVSRKEGWQEGKGDSLPANKALLLGVVTGSRVAPSASPSMLTFLRFVGLVLT